MTAQKPESRLTAKIIESIKARPAAHAHKTHGSPYSDAGEPDIDACVAGRAVKIEVKMPGKKPTPNQYASMRRWERAGALAGWATSVEEADRLLAHLTEPGWKNPQLT